MAIKNYYLGSSGPYRYDNATSYRNYGLGGDGLVRAIDADEGRLGALLASLLELFLSGANLRLDDDDCLALGDGSDFCFYYDSGTDDLRIDTTSGADKLIFTKAGALTLASHLTAVNGTFTGNISAVNADFSGVLELGSGNETVSSAAGKLLHSAFEQNAAILNDVLSWNGSEWVPAAVSGIGGAPADATYVTLSTNATLTNERVLTGTANQITVTDGGAGAAVTLSTPQNIHTGATPTFDSLTLTNDLTVQDIATFSRSSTNGRLFGSSGNFTLDNSTGSIILSALGANIIELKTNSVTRMTVASSGGCNFATSVTTPALTVNGVATLGSGDVSISNTAAIFGDGIVDYDVTIGQDGANARSNNLIFKQDASNIWWVRVASDIFIVRDHSAGTEPFKITGGAPTNSFVMNADGSIDLQTGDLTVDNDIFIGGILYDNTDNDNNIDLNTLLGIKIQTSGSMVFLIDADNDQTGVGFSFHHNSSTSLFVIHDNGDIEVATTFPTSNPGPNKLWNDSGTIKMGS